MSPRAFLLDSSARRARAACARRTARSRSPALLHPLTWLPCRSVPASPPRLHPLARPAPGATLLHLHPAAAARACVAASRYSGRITAHAISTTGPTGTHASLPADHAEGTSARLPARAVPLALAHPDLHHAAPVGPSVARAAMCTVHPRYLIPYEAIRAARAPIDYRVLL